MHDAVNIPADRIQPSHVPKIGSAALYIWRGCDISGQWLLVYEQAEFVSACKKVPRNVRTKIPGGASY
jgi:hypothetical protein